MYYHKDMYNTSILPSTYLLAFYRLFSCAICFMDNSEKFQTNLPKMVDKKFQIRKRNHTLFSETKTQFLILVKKKGKLRQAQFAQLSFINIGQTIDVTFTHSCLESYIAKTYRVRHKYHG